MSFEYLIEKSMQVEAHLIEQEIDDLEMNKNIEKYWKGSSKCLKQTFKQLWSYVRLTISFFGLFIVGGDDFVLRNSQLRLCLHGLIFCEVAKLLFNSNFLLGVGSRFYSDIGFPNFLDLFFSLDLCSSVAFVDFTILHWTKVILWGTIGRI